MVERKTAFAVELGRRIDDAWDRAGFASRAEMQRAAGLDYQQLAKWCRGVAVPHVESLAAIARVCAVSLDWLVLGADWSPDVFLTWLETPTGASSTSEARAFLRSLPLHGYRPSLAFYDLAHQAWKLGLTEEDASLAARTTERAKK